jgi:molybdate transport system substrate-binding protein
MHRKFTFLILLSVLALPSCAPMGASQVFPVLPVQSDQQTLTVFAAASLTGAFGVLAARFETENPGVEVILNFAGSQQLAQQITQGAPADLFASANEIQMNNVIQTGRVDSGEVKIFASNRIAVIYPSDNPATLEKLGDLRAPGLSIVLSDPAVPVGRYSLEFLEEASSDPGFGTDYKDDVLKNVVSYEENVKAVLSKIILGEADAGIVYVSDIWGDGEGSVGALVIPESLNVAAVYTIAPIADSSQMDLARKFTTYVLSSSGQEILIKYGLLTPSTHP